MRQLQMDAQIKRGQRAFIFLAAGVDECVHTISTTRRNKDVAARYVDNVLANVLRLKESGEGATVEKMQVQPGIAVSIGRIKFGNLQTGSRLYRLAVPFNKSLVGIHAVLYGDGGLQTGEVAVVEIPFKLNAAINGVSRVLVMGVQRILDQGDVVIGLPVEEGDTGVAAQLIGDGSP
jgi:hypothetical protein